MRTLMHQAPQKTSSIARGRAVGARVPPGSPMQRLQQRFSNRGLQGMLQEWVNTAGAKDSAVSAPHAGPQSSAPIKAPDRQEEDAREIAAAEIRKPLSITHETLVAAPDGSPKDRIDVGVAEVVTFTGSKRGVWTASAGASVVLSRGKQMQWKAPVSATSAAIELTVGEEKAKTIINVVEPAYVTAKKEGSDLTFPSALAGAGMHLRFGYHPMHVSFGNVGAKEISGVPSSIWGSLTRFTSAQLYHDADYYSGGSFLSIGANNIDAGPDTVFFSENKRLTWSEDGGCDYDIPINFGPIGTKGVGKEFTTVCMTYKITGPPQEGTVTVEKLGQSATRARK